MDEIVDLAADWNEISAGLKKDLGAQIHSQWIRPLRLGQFDDKAAIVTLLTPSEFAAKWINERFADRLALAWKILRPDVKQVNIMARSDARDRHDRDHDFNQLDYVQQKRNFNYKTLDGPSQLSIGLTGLNPAQTFDNFVTGQTNILACNAAQRIAAAEKPLFSPLYLKGLTGQGKTHLLHAIGNAWLGINPRAGICYCPAEKFMNDFVRSLQKGETMNFKARYRGYDMLLIDDVQFIIGKSKVQEEFLHTLDALMAQGNRLVVTADRAPQELEGVDQRLLSRLSMGLVADIQPADIDLRRAILNAAIEQLHVDNVSDEVIDFLARTANRNVRELIGALNKLVACASVSGQTVTLALAQDQLADILKANRRRITIDEIQRTVCQFFHIDRSEMSSKRRARAVVRPRQVAMYLAKTLTPRSYPEIGRKFGGRDHSTVIHAVKLIEELRQRDADMDSDVRSLLQQLEG